MVHRLTILALLLLATPVAPACAPDPGPRCQQAYDHLIRLAKRRPEPDQRQRFLGACRAAWDEGHHRCLLGARTVEAALECRPRKTRPG